MKWTLLFISLFFVAHSYSQNIIAYKTDTSTASVEYWQSWYKDLYQTGIDIKKDSFTISPEFLKIARDSVYKKMVYPSVYTWLGVRDLLSHMELKKAFWYMIKLYGTDTANKRLAIGCLLAYANNIDIERVVTSSYYTYAFLDPAVATIRNEKPVFTRPDILESELNDVKQMIAYVRALKKPQQSAAGDQTSN